ncbi:MAG TPA: heme-binding domain-containing protein, partial [Pyrinomonadaceae bacterium]|nr:heme-binding domain-containing protein [Pyrinomonadaceae bacterium]
MKKVLKVICIGFALLFAVAQFVRPDRTLPAIDPAMTLDTTATVPEDVRAILGRSCNDCHSNETVYPWYSNVSPASWFLQNHIDEGRNELNFSLW